MNTLQFVMVALTLALTSSPGMTQEIRSNIDNKAEISEILQEVDRQVWTPFTKALHEKDNQTYTAVHSHKVLRLSNDHGGIVETGQSYFQKNDQLFNRLKENSVDVKIDFAFLERTVAKNLVSDVGYYRYTMTKPQQPSKFIYGKFHVVSAKEADAWKIILDYDYTDQEGKYKVSASEFEKAFLGR